MKMKDTLHVMGTLGSENYLVELTTTRHTIKIDEPESLGGSDQYPNPAQYLLSALASCTAITIKMYANNKGWDVGEIHVDVKMKDVISSGKTRTQILVKLDLRSSSYSSWRRFRFLQEK